MEKSKYVPILFVLISIAFPFFFTANNEAFFEITTSMISAIPVFLGMITLILTVTLEISIDKRRLDGQSSVIDKSETIIQPIKYSAILWGLYFLFTMSTNVISSFIFTEFILDILFMYIPNSIINFLLDYNIKICISIFLLIYAIYYSAITLKEFETLLRKITNIIKKSET